MKNKASHFVISLAIIFLCSSFIHVGSINQTTSPEIGSEIIQKDQYYKQYLKNYRYFTESCMNANLDSKQIALFFENQLNLLIQLDKNYNLSELDNQEFITLFKTEEVFSLTQNFLFSCRSTYNSCMDKANKTYNDAIRSCNGSIGCQLGMYTRWLSDASACSSAYATCLVIEEPIQS